MYGMRWYDRSGEEVTMEQAIMLAADFEYRVVEQTQVGPYWVSTVWLHGIDHSFMGEGPPILFETMVFAHDGSGTEGRLGPDVDYQPRYATEEQAKAGHAETVLLVRATLVEEISETDSGFSECEVGEDD